MVQHILRLFAIFRAKKSCAHYIPTLFRSFNVIYPLCFYFGDKVGTCLIWGRVRIWQILLPNELVQRFGIFMHLAYLDPQDNLITFASPVNTELTGVDCIIR